MPEDIRIHVGFKDHIKTKKLLKILGAEGLKSLIFLWLSARETRPKGNLDGLAEEDIELMGDWSGLPNLFVPALVNIGWIDKAEDGTLSLHDWETWQRFAFFSEERSEQATNAIRIRWEKKANTKRIRNEYKTNTNPNTPSPSPLPFPVPSPSPNPTPIPPPTEAEVVAAWNAIEGIHKVQDFTDNRKKALAARLKKESWIRSWKTALVKVSQSNFCKGGGERKWVADIDWFLQPDTMTKILEGKYDERPKPGNGDSGHSLPTQQQSGFDYSRIGRTISNLSVVPTAPATIPPTITEAPNAGASPKQP